LLDVRAPQAAAGGRMDGFMNIPLEDLRDRVDELDRAKPVYTLCHSGMRSYNAARILTQNGFDVYNLSGGYRLYSAVKQAF
jgi:rhodanese-related sulfurtransferase